MLYYGILWNFNLTTRGMADFSYKFYIINICGIIYCFVRSGSLIELSLVNKGVRWVSILQHVLITKTRSVQPRLAACFAHVCYIHQI